MEFTSKFNELKGILNLSDNINYITNSSIAIHNFDFKSKISLDFPFEDLHDPYSLSQLYVRMDMAIKENESFRYPVIVPKSDYKYKSAIILLHGLNEKSWQKYLPWAYYLAEQVDRPIILFPISFHMNRCPESWGNPRAMISLLNQRQRTKNVSMCTFANVALSERLTEEPLRFFRSGHQSAEDIIDLIQGIKIGDHPLFKPNAQVDFFAYSIGAFLSQILFIANPNNLFNNSRLFLFCGGIHFNHMYGTSRLIMDNLAYSSLRKYYLGSFINEMKAKTPFSNYVTKSPLGNAFRAMLAPEILKSFRESILQKLGNQIKVVALKKDNVIPANYIESTFSCVKKSFKKMIEILDFPYTYSHETPFPVLNNSTSLMVDQGFERVFRSAIEFLK